MDQQAIQHSKTLEAVSSAIANWTVDRHVEVDPDLPERYGSVWRDIWTNDVSVRLGHLAQGLAVRRPALFEQSVGWSRDAFIARNVPESDLKTSLACLREVIAAELPRGVADDAVSMIEAAERSLGCATEPPASQLDEGSPHYGLALRYLEALLDGRPGDAETMVLEAAAAGTSVADLHMHVLQPVQVELGRLWHLHEITVADEHLATVVTGNVVSRLRQYLEPGPPNGRRVVTCSVGGDLHEIAARMVSDFFQSDGWDVIPLGANLPREDMLLALERYGAQVVALSASTTLHMRTTGELIDAVRAHPVGAGLKILVGGGPFNDHPDLWREVGADGSARSGAEAVKVANALFSNGH